MKTLAGLLLFVLIHVFSLSAAAQVGAVADSVSPVDSLNRKLIEFTDRIRQNEQERLSDSIRRLELQRELELVKASDYMRRKELQDRLTQLEQADSLLLEQKRRHVEAILQSNSGIPVAPFGDTLFLIYNKIGAYTPSERAESISNRIKELYRDTPFYPDSMKIVLQETTHDLEYRGKIIMSITEMDALINHTDRATVTQEYRKIINQAVLDYISYTSLSNILKRIGLVLLTLGVVALLIFFLTRLFRFTKKYIETHQDKFVRSINIRNYELLSRDKMLKGILWINSLVRIFFYILVVYLALPPLFSIFPVTKHWADTLLRWIIDPIFSIFMAFVNYLPDLITVIIIVVVVRYLVKLLKYLAKEVQMGKLSLPGFHPDYAMPTFGIVRFVLYAFMFVVIFPYLPGSDSDIFKGVSVFLGILVSLGSSSAISNMVAGLVITYMRPFKVGDRIKLGDVTGDVIEKTPLVIRIRTIKNEEITIPNSQILTGHTINYSASGRDLGLILHTTLTIGYDAPWRKVHELLISAAKSTDGISAKPEPFVLQTSLDDYYVSYQINAYTRFPENASRIYSDLHMNIQDKFNEGGVEIMSPHYRALRDGNQVTIPPEYLPGDYTPPTFRVNDREK